VAPGDEQEIQLGRYSRCRDDLGWQSPAGVFAVTWRSALPKRAENSPGIHREDGGMHAIVHLPAEPDPTGDAGYGVFSLMNVA